MALIVASEAHTAEANRSHLCMKYLLQHSSFDSEWLTGLMCMDTGVCHAWEKLFFFFLRNVHL